MIYEYAAFRNDLIPHCIVRLNNLVAQLGKGGLISEGIFTLVASSKERCQITILNFFTLAGFRLKS